MTSVDIDMKHTKEQIEQRARGRVRNRFCHPQPERKGFWLRSARYRLQQDAIVNAVDNAVENEATTKGWDNAHQGAWELSTFMPRKQAFPLTVT